MWQPPWHFLAQAQGRIKRADLYPPHLLPDDVLIVIVCWSALTIRQASGATELGQLAIIPLVITALAVFVCNTIVLLMRLQSILLVVFRAFGFSNLVGRSYLL